MNKKLKKEFDRQTGTELLVNENDKKRFYEWVSTHNSKKKNFLWFPKLMTTLLFMGLIAIVYTAYGSTHLLNLFDQTSTEREFETYFFDLFVDELSEDEMSLNHVEVGIVQEKDVLATYNLPEHLGEGLTIGYFRYKEDGGWLPINGRSINWKDPVVWLVEKDQYLYTGVTSGDASQVEVGAKHADIISVSDGKQLWYVTTDQTDEQVTITMSDGSQKVIEEIPPPPQLLAEEEGQYKALIVTENVIEDQDILDNFRDPSVKMKGMRLVPLESAKRSYPSLNIQQPPSFYIFNHKELVFQSNDLEETLEFMEDKGLFKNENE